MYQVEIFKVLPDVPSTIDELNLFLRTHQIIETHSEFVNGNNAYFLYRVHYINTGDGVRTTPGQHKDSLSRERNKKTGDNDSNDGTRKGGVDYYKLVSDEKRSAYMKLRSARAAVSYDNNNWDTRFSIARDKDLYGIVMKEGDITVEAIKNNPDVDSRVHPFAEALVKYFNMRDDELGKLVDGFKAEMDDKKRQAIEMSVRAQTSGADILPNIAAVKTENIKTGNLNTGNVKTEGEKAIDASTASIDSLFP
ncbi:MAG: hypothetical protein LBG17_02115 [Bacteroidales bacterium]|nr:hypothetical protein [Bacteroidales bacterium]